jgi:hypothetical protein
MLLGVFSTRILTRLAARSRRKSVKALSVEAVEGRDALVDDLQILAAPSPTSLHSTKWKSLEGFCAHSGIPD